MIHISTSTDFLSLQYVCNFKTILSQINYIVKFNYLFVTYSEISSASYRSSRPQNNSLPGYTANQRKVMRMAEILNRLVRITIDKL